MLCQLLMWNPMSLWRAGEVAVDVTIWGSRLRPRKRNCQQKDIGIKIIPAMSVIPDTVFQKRRLWIQRHASSVTWGMIIHSGRCGKAPNTEHAGLPKTLEICLKMLKLRRARTVTFRKVLMKTALRGAFLE